MQEKQLILRPVDIVILLKKITPDGYRMNGKQLAESLGISPAEVSVSMERTRIAQLLDEKKSRVNVLALRDLLCYGIRYCFPVQPGRMIRGIPTASSAKPLRESIASNGDEYVWKDMDGTVRGQAIVPLYRNAPFAAKRDADLYALLAIVDSFRLGKTRERVSAEEELQKYLDQYVAFEQ